METVTQRRFYIGGIQFPYPKIVGISEADFKKKYGDEEVSGIKGKKIHGLDKEQIKNAWDSLKKAIKVQKADDKAKADSEKGNKKKSEEARKVQVNRLQNKKVKS